MTSIVNQKIPWFDLSRQYEMLKTEIQEAIQSVMVRSAFSGGPFVQQFEDEFANFCGARFAVGLNSGTSALHLALVSLGLGPGDEVVVPANTFIATAWAPSYVGATPVFVDCESDTWSISLESLARKITKKTRAIMAVHLYGTPCNLKALAKIAGEHRLLLIEDAAQAHGATIDGSPVGTVGHLAAFSFYPGKNLGAFGEGGAVITNNESHASRIRTLRQHASSERYYHDELGYNMRMDGIQAAILSVKLKHLPRFNKRRREIAKLYREGMTNPMVKLPHEPLGYESVHHLYVVTADNRERFVAHLREKGIEVGFHYPVPCHLQKAYAHLKYKKGDLPNCEYLASHCVTLPMFPELTDSEVLRVIEAVNTYE